MMVYIIGSFNDICGYMNCVLCAKACKHVGTLRHDFQLKELCCLCYSEFYDSTFKYRCESCKPLT